MVVAVMQKTGHGLLYKYQSQGPGTSHKATVARVKSSGQCPSTQTLLLPELEERRGRGHLTGPRDRVEVRGGEGGTTPDLVRGRIAEA